MSIETSKRVIVKRDLKPLFPKEFTSRELIGKFFDYVMNNFFEKSYARFINGYIGKRTQTLEEGNFYIKEPTTERQLYQLTPMLITRDNENNINGIVDYTNFINTLKLQGSIINDHNRLLNNEHWSFCPPIDVDMFLNYNFYYWVEENTNLLKLKNETNAERDIIGKPNYTYEYIDDNGKKTSVEFKNDMRIIFYNDVNPDYNEKSFIIKGVNESITLINGGSGLKPIYLTGRLNAVTDIIGKANYTYEYDNNEGEHIRIPFYNGMRIIFKKDDNYEYNNKCFIVEGVAKSIILVDDSENYNPLNTKEPEYFVMERGCKDANPWSLRNKWFHIDDIKNANLYNQIDNDNMSYIQAKKPILCFDRDIELYNFGTRDRGWVDIITKTPKNEINGKIIDKDENNGKLLLDGIYLKNNSKILFTNEPNAETNNMIYELFLIDNGDKYIATLYPVVNGEDPDGKPLLNECIKVRNKLIQCYHYNGEEWIPSQQKTQHNQSPLFNLYDKNKTPLDDKEIYPNSNFDGNTIFNYKTTDNKSVKYDEDINRKLIITDYGNYVFDNTIISQKYSYKEITTLGIQTKPIEGYNFYKINDANIAYKYNILRGEIPSAYKFMGSINFSKLPSPDSSNLNAVYTITNSFTTDDRFIIGSGKTYSEGTHVVVVNTSDNYKNCWNLSTDKVTQYVITELTVTDENIKNQKTFIDEKGLELTYEPFELAYEPSESDYKENIFVYLNGQFIEKGSSFKEGMYFLEGKTLWVSLKTELKEYDTIYVKMLINKNDGELADGYVYDLPQMLYSNGLNEDITEIKYNEMFDQCESILKNQLGFTGLVNGINNYKDTLKDTSLGTAILQHSTPILKTMLLNSKEYTNIRNVLSNVAQDYTKFKNKFTNVIQNMSETDEYTEYQTIEKNSKIYYTPIKTNPLIIVSKALNKINIGKTGLKPYYNNGVAEQLINLDDESENYLVEPYIPSTPAYLGLDNCYEPEILTPSETNLNKNILLCHDGSYDILFNDYRDDAKLALEKSIYDSIDTRFKEGLPAIIKQKYIPGKFRNTDYTYDEYLKIYTPLFEKWIVDNDLDYSINNTFDEENTFTWNWSTCYDKDGFKLPGSYRAIYLYYYDTDKPHTNPWEMLGFGSKPEWWEEYYGSAPYTSENYPMWKDIEDGHIVDGISKGYYKEFERKGLIENYLPVDEKGNLLDPYQAGIATTKPILKYAKDPWKIGDIGHIENIWRYTSEYRYALQTILYLMKPLEWLETSWDSINTDVLFRGTFNEQIINVNSGIRDVQNDIIMHNEYIDGNYVRKLGSQQWFSDFLTSETINITDYIGNDLRSMKLQLGYRCAGFYDNETIKVLSDNYGIIPSNNYQLKLGSRVTGNVYRYSGIIIQKLPNGWLLDGFDEEYPYFNYFEPIKNGRKSPVEINGRNFTYYNTYSNNLSTIRYKTIITSSQEVYNILCGYEKYLESIGFVFNVIGESGEQIDFRYDGRKFLLWCDNPNVEDGSLLLLNPMRYGLTLKHDGFVDIVGKFFNGHWSIKNTSPANIYNKDISIYRHNGYISVNTKNDDEIASIKFTTSEKENILIIDNKTIYGDVLYDSLKGTKTERLKFLGTKANGWNGTYYAPGYIINMEETIEPDYDKLADDLVYVYDSDDIKSFGKMGEEARKTIGYKKTKYMESLLIDNRNMFDFYKGMLKEKGTRLSFNKLNRSTHIMSEGSSKLNLDEFWAFNVGQFGYTKNKATLEFLINAEKITHDPQIVTFSSDPNYSSLDNSNIDINWESDEWLKKHNNQDRNCFEYKNKNDKLPIGGFAHLDDCKYILENKEMMENEVENISVNDKIWVVKDNDYTWNMYKRIDDDDNPFKSLKVNNIKELLSYNNKNLDKDDLIYIEKDNLSNNLISMDDNINDTNKYLNIYINDPNDLVHNQNYITEDYGWSVFKYIAEPYNNILSMPNGIISLNDIGDNYKLRIEKDLLLNLPNGSNGETNEYKEYLVKDNIDIELSEGKYIIFTTRNDIDSYFISNNFTISDTAPIPTGNKDFWYNPYSNLFSRWNNAFWENALTKLYAWDHDNTTYYTLDETPTLTSIIYDATDINNIQVANKKITKIIDKMYAWVYNDNTYYTKSEKPKAGDKIYDSTRINDVDIISSFFDGADYLYCDNKKYIRSTENDFESTIIIQNATILINLGNNEFIRNENKDIEPPYFCLLAEIQTDNGDNSEIKLTDISVSNPYILERIEQKPININLIKSVYLVDNKTDKSFSKAYLFDPLHCVVPDFLSKELDYITSYDPVNYNNGNNWVDNKVGRLWWDTSKVRYIDYYQDSLKYRRDNWGKQLPGSEIDIMEWTKSTTLPNGIEKYVTQEIYNVKTSKNDTYYYFWLKNPSELPDVDFRTMTAYDISRKINSPQEQGIVWFSPINLTNRIYDDSSFIVSNFDSVAASQDFVIQINFKNINDVNNHNEWYLIVEDSSEIIPNNLWDKMKVSLIGEMIVDGEKVNVPDESLTENERYGIQIRPRQTMFKNIVKARRNFVDVCNDIFGSRDILTASTDNFNDILLRDSSYENYDIIETFTSHEQMILSVDKTIIGHYVLVENDELYDGIWTLWLVNSFGNYKLIDYQKYDMSRYTYFIDAFLNNEYSKDTYNMKLYNVENANTNDNVNERLQQLIDNGIPDGYPVRIDDKSTKEWMLLLQYNDTTRSFNTVGIKDGYIQLNDLLYSYMENIDNSIFINDETKYEYDDREVKTIIEILCNYFEER